jgi:hypothetical protein
MDTRLLDALAHIFMTCSQSYISHASPGYCVHAMHLHLSRFCAWGCSSCQTRPPPPPHSSTSMCQPLGLFPPLLTALKAVVVGEVGAVWSWLLPVSGADKVLLASTGDCVFLKGLRQHPDGSLSRFVHS